MLIDFHTHALPDDLAQRGMEKLSKITNTIPYSSGTASALSQIMREHGVDKYVVLHIATKPWDQRKVNDFAANMTDDNAVCFGSVHPLAEDALPELDRIKSLGLKGIKLHPDYQSFDCDTDEAMAVYEKCAGLNLPIVFHAGYDPVSPGNIHCPPEKLRIIADIFPDLTIVAAHMGGMMCYNDVEKYLVGLDNVYLDISMSASCFHDKEQYKRIINHHGADKILFASDCPWSTPEIEMRMLEGAGLSGGDMDLICCKNALKLLGGSLEAQRGEDEAFERGC